MGYYPMNENEENVGSLPLKKRGVTVSASPFNVVKLELGIILFLTVIVWVLVDKLVTNPVSQLLWLGGFGVVFMSWLLIRISVLKRGLSKKESE